MLKGIIALGVGVALATACTDTRTVTEVVTATDTVTVTRTDTVTVVDTVITGPDTIIIHVPDSVMVDTLHPPAPRAASVTFANLSAQSEDKRWQFNATLNGTSTGNLWPGQQVTLSDTASWLSVGVSLHRNGPPTVTTYTLAPGDYDVKAENGNITVVPK